MLTKGARRVVLQEGEYAAVTDGSKIGAVAIHDAIRAAQREGEFEQLARERAEAELESVTEALLESSKKVKQLQVQLQEAQKSVSKVSGLERQLKGVSEDLSKAQEELAGTRKKLKDCKQDALSKTERLKAAKVWKKSSTECSQNVCLHQPSLVRLTGQCVPQEKEARLTSVMEELAAEKESHAQASKKLEQVKGALERKTATIARLKEAQSSASAEPAYAASTEALEQRIQSLQATIDKKEDTLRQV